MQQMGRVRAGGQNFVGGVTIREGAEAASRKGTEWQRSPCIGAHVPAFQVRCLCPYTLPHFITTVTVT